MNPIHLSDAQWDRVVIWDRLQAIREYLSAGQLDPVLLQRIDSTLAEAHAEIHPKLQKRWRIGEIIEKQPQGA